MAVSSSSNALDMGLGLDDTHVLVTGGCGLIGKVVVNAFLSAGAKVSVVDLPNSSPPFDLSDSNVIYIPGDITKDIDAAFTTAEAKFGPIETCVALASLDLSVLRQADTICDLAPSDWQRVFDVNINGTFFTCQRWLQGIRTASQSPETKQKLKNVSLVIIGSESGRFGVRTQAAYAAAKSAVQFGLMYSLAKDAPRIYADARVNAVAPGAVDTERLREEMQRYGPVWTWEECEATVPLARAVPVEDVARTVAVLASQRFSRSVHGQVLPVDGGKMGSLVWTREELERRRVGEV